MDPQCERRVAQLNGTHQHVVQRKEDWHLNQQREAATQWVHFLCFIQGHHFLALTLFVIAQTLTHRLNLRLQHAHLRHGGVLRFSQRVHDATNDEGDNDDGEAPVTQEAVDELQQLKQRLRDEPQPTVIHGQIQVRRNSGHFVLNFRANPQGAGELTGLTRLYQNRLRFVADGCKAVTQVRGIEVVGTVVIWHPRRREILLQHRHPTAFSADVQVFVIGNGVEFVFLVLRVRRGVRRATEGVQRKVAASGVTVRRQIDGLLQLAKGRQLQRFRTGVLYAVAHVHRILTALQGEGFGEGVACGVGIGHRDNEFVLAISQHKGVVLDVIQWTRTVSRVIRAVTTGQAALRLVDKLRRGFQ